MGLSHRTQYWTRKVQKEAYRTGRGKIKVRAITNIEPMENGKNRIVVTELPYMVNKARLIQNIANLVKNSASHWAYVGSSEYSYIAVGVTYESGLWYCDVAVARENTDNK